MSRNPRGGPLWICAAGSTMLFPAISSASLLGTTPLDPGNSVVPGLVPSGTPAGSLLNYLISPFSYPGAGGTLAEQRFTRSPAARSISTTRSLMILILQPRFRSWAPLFSAPPLSVIESTVEVYPDPYLQTVPWLRRQEIVVVPRP